MAFTDPVEFNPDGTPQDLFRIISGFNTSTYANEDSSLVLKAEHNYARRTRRVFRIDTNKITPDPFIPTQNTKVSASVYVVADLPVAGFDLTEIANLYGGLNACLMAGGSPNRLGQWLSGQS